MNWNDFLYYKDGRVFWKDPHCTRLKPGDEAGSRHHRGYWYIRRYDKITPRHRIVWEMHNGPIPDGMEIDHINHVPGDDRIENLRMVTRLINNRNKRKPSTNTSGTVGVAWNNMKNKWIAQIKIDGKTKILYYGDSFDDALIARKDAEKIHGFHRQHGS